MQSGWKRAEYKIAVHQNGRILSATVYGFTKSGFGIHEADSGWNITHLASGWNSFTAESEKGAGKIAQHLIENYHSDFERLTVAGVEIQNYKMLAKKIRADVELKELLRLFTDEAEYKKGWREIGVKIIS